MTKPDNPEAAESSSQLTQVADDIALPAGGEVSATERTGFHAAPDDLSVPDDLSGNPTPGPPRFGQLAPEEPAAEQPVAEDLVPDEPTDDGVTSGSTAPVPPRPSVATSVVDGGPSTVQLKLDELESSSQAGGTRFDQQRPASRAYGYSSSSGPGPAAASTRYGQPVAPPFKAQPNQGAGQDFSGPTVRIGGRVQSEQASPQPSLSTRVRPTRIPRRTSLQLRHLEPWSVLKVSLVLSVAGFLAWMVAVGVLYNVLGSMGVWDQLNGTYSDLTSVSSPRGGEDLISAGGVFGVAAVVGLVNIVLITAMCTVGAFIYNASADLAGGIEVTLSERD
ncbi:MAG: DUF3566 domain-containing protein [Pseudonocardiales bacterium]